MATRCVRAFPFLVVATVAVLVAGAGSAGATFLLGDDFQYGGSTGDLTAVSLLYAPNNWVAHSGGGVGPVDYLTGNLTLGGYIYSGLGGSAATAAVVGQTEDVNRSFAPVASGDVYAAALVNISSCVNSQYFFHVKNATTGYWGRVWAGDDGSGNLKFGVTATSNTAPTFPAANFSYNTTYLVVVRYSKTTGTAALHVLTTVPLTEPATPLQENTAALVAGDVVGVGIRQPSSATTANGCNAVIDGIRVATTWAEAVLPPALMIGDVSANEGNSGTTNFNFAVTLTSPAGPGGVTFNASTAHEDTDDSDLTALTNAPYSIAAGSSSTTVTVQVNGDTDVEVDEQFYVNLSSVVGADEGDVQGLGTILNDDSASPTLSIDNVTANETNSGTTTFRFTVSLSAAAPAGGVTFDIDTADGTATIADSDYVANSADAVTIAEGETQSFFDVFVTGDTDIELTESFFVDVTNVSGATVADGQGVGTITNDDAWTCLAAVPLVANQWRQLGLPCVPVEIPAGTLRELFADELGAAGYGTIWRVYRYDEVAEAYVQLALDDTVSQGEGYFIKSTVGGAIGMAGNDTSTATDFLIPVTGGAGDGLFNMPGHPFDFAVDWPDVTVDCGAGEVALDVAEGAGLAWANMWKWNGAAYQSYHPLVTGAEGVLNTFDGFWFRAIAPAGCTLHIPPIPAESLPGRETFSGPWGWYVRLEASSGAMVDPGNVLGQHRQASTGNDRMDLEEMAPPFGSEYLTVVFPHPEWGEAAGDYTVEYHRLGAPDQWRFEVRSSEPEAEVTLRWRGPARALWASTLVDEATGEEIRVFRRSGEGTYTFTLKEGTRSFLWKVRQIQRATGAESE